MLDAVTLAEIRTFLTVVEEGSFSAAARRLGRVQSAVSQAVANLEGQLGISLFDRTTKVPKLSEHGRALVPQARRVLSDVDDLLGRAKNLSGGTEARVSLCVDSLFPLPLLVEACEAFALAYPLVDLCVSTETLTAVTARVLSGEATLGVVAPLGLSASLERRALFAVRMVPCAAARHPLALAAARPSGVTMTELSEHVQIVLTERTEDGVPDQAVLSVRTWRVGDLHTKRAMMLAALGWGNLPEPMIDADLRAGRLVNVSPLAWKKSPLVLQLSAVYRANASFGPAHRWLVDKLEALGRQSQDERLERENDDPTARKKRTRG